MTSISWNAEGGSAGVTISPANSGGASGTAWDTVSIVANGTAVYDNTPALTGNMSAKVATGITSGSVFMQWGAAITALWASGMTTHYGRAYLRYTSLPSVNRIVIQWVDTTLATNRGNFLLLTTGALRLRNAANGTVATFTTTLSIDTTYRLEWRADGSATGAYRMDLFLGNNASAIESIVGGTANFGGTIGGASFGYLTNGASIANQWIDSIQLNDTGLPGPASTNYSQSAAASVTATASVTKNVGKTVAASATTTATAVKNAGKNIAAACTTAVTATRGVGKTATAACTSTVTATRGVGKNIAAACTVTASITATVHRVQATTANVTVTPGAQVNVGKTAAASVTTTATAVTSRNQTPTAHATVTARVGIAVAKAVLAPATATPNLTRAIRLRQSATVTVATLVRAQAPARLIVLTIAPPTTRWTVGEPVAGLFTISDPVSRWRTGRPLVQQYASTSLEYVPVPVTAMVNGSPYNPTNDPVYMLFTSTFDAPTAGSSDWKAATWTTGTTQGTYLANCLIGPGGTLTLTPGVYQVWIKITDSPEVPIRYSGQIEVLP